MSFRYFHSKIKHVEQRCTYVWYTVLDVTTDTYDTTLRACREEVQCWTRMKGAIPLYCADIMVTSQDTQIAFPYFLMSRRLMFASYVMMTSQLEYGVGSMLFTPMTSPVLRYCCFSPHIHHMNEHVNSTDATWMFISDRDCDCIFLSTALQQIILPWIYYATLHCIAGDSSLQLSSLTLLLALPLPSTAISQDD